MVPESLDNMKKGQQRTRNDWFYSTCQWWNPNCDWPSVLKGSSRTIYPLAKKPSYKKGKISAFATGNEDNLDNAFTAMKGTSWKAVAVLWVAS